MRLIDTWPLVLLFTSFSATQNTSIVNDNAPTNQTLGSLAGILGGDQTFDYVIVGAGTAGLAVAYRLSEDPSMTVAVVEAGSFYQITEPILSSTPAGDVVFVGSDPSDSDPLSDWVFVTTPQAGAAGRKIHYCRGKVLGGSSARNFMIYQRGTVGTFQQWAEAVGDDGYTWDNFLPYYKKGITFTPPDMSKRAANATPEFDASAFDSTDGPLQVSYANYGQPFSSYMQGAFTEIGMLPKKDFNSGSLLGAQYCSSTINPSDQMRASSQTTYLDAANGRSNLKVFQLTAAQKVLFDSNKKATGVSVKAAGLVPFVLNANKEVILSAGAFQSPQLLMLSGIGPSETLKKFDIDVLVDNPNVGQNMWDHVFAGPTYRVSVDTLTKLDNDLIYLGEQFLAYNFFKTGPLTNPIADFLGWEKVPDDLRASFTNETENDLSQFPDDWPEIEYISGAGYVGDFSNLFLTQPKDGFQYATILSTIVAPISRGNVTLASASADDLPIINPNWLTSPTDQQVAVAAYKRARQAFKSKFMSQIIIGDEYFPGSNVTTDEEILDTYRKTLLTVWHAACTCKMGKTDDPTAVVDSQARVIGVRGLRVVDASAFPILPPGHPQSTVYALAEKISDAIKSADGDTIAADALTSKKSYTERNSPARVSVFILGFVSLVLALYFL